MTLNLKTWNRLLKIGFFFQIKRNTGMLVLFSSLSKILIVNFTIWHNLMLCFCSNTSQGIAFIFVVVPICNNIQCYCTINMLEKSSEVIISNFFKLAKKYRKWPESWMFVFFLQYSCTHIIATKAKQHDSASHHLCILTLQNNYQRQWFMQIWSFKY